MSAELVKELHEQRLINKAHDMMHRAFVGQLELEIFSERDESLVALQRLVAEEYLSHDLPNKSDLMPLIGIMLDNASGKQVAKYRYLWGEVMSADIYAMFQDAGIADSQKMREMGMLFRKLMVEPGALLEGRAGFREFRGRDMSPDAMFAMYRC